MSVTLAFDEYAGTPDDEAPLAREVARALGTDHREVRVRAPEDLWERAIAAMDQPSIDGFNSYLVSAAAREAGLKVALSGLGGDELFGSYPSFRDVPRWHRGAKMGALLPGAPFLWPGIARYLRPSAPKLRGLLRHGTSFEGAYLLRRGLYLPEELPALLGARVAQDALAEAAGAWARPDVNDEPDAWRRVQVLETSLYMRNQLLRDTDWASMAHSLEVRVPLVDAPLRGALARDGFAAPRAAGKAALVRRVAPGLPAALFERPKTGFSVPVTRWMRIPGAATSRGLGSRGLALEVLRTFGVELPVEKAA